ncbi:MAG: EscU/YscU/HrcU family type III secretion system export apparatus switch protein, partial [Gemmatimonadaceae bacterium]
AVLLLGIALVLTAVLPSVANRLFVIMGESLASIGDTSFTAEAAVKTLQMLGWRTLSTILLVAASMAAMALVVNAAQARGVLSLKPITPQFKRINPASNVKRLVGMQALVELLKSLGKLTIVGFAIHAALGKEAINAIVVTSQQSPRALLQVVMHFSVKLILTAGLAYLVLALSDYLWQYWQFTKEMRMSKAEIKQEFKNSEGDPLLKQRMRSIGRALARKQMLKDVVRADVVIVNPTRRAIALQYDPSKAPAPIVLAMGERKVAERIKKIAIENGVPIVENRPLAIALIKHARVGMVIPLELYLAVAEVLAFVIRQRNERGARWAYRPISHLVGDTV